MKAVVQIKLIIIALFMSITFNLSAHGAGVTIITHGFQSDTDTWILEMANAIWMNADLSDMTWYEVEVTEPKFIGGPLIVTLLDNRIGGPPLTRLSGEIIIFLNWSAIDALAFVDTTKIAEYVVPKLLEASFVNDLNNRPLSELPFHLIGHSRGGSLVSEIARLLGENGIWVDQMTTLDPHPVNTFGVIGDAEPLIYENILFADNYYRDDLDPADFDGHPISGAYNRYLDGLAGLGYIFEHQDTHLWYHGTIDTTVSASDGNQTIDSNMRTSWWNLTGDDGGKNTGFRFSRIASNALGDIRNSSGIINGYSILLHGNGNRIALNKNNATWSNIVEIELLDGSSNKIDDHIPILTIGDPFRIGFWYSSYNNNWDAQFLLDNDRNPYNNSDNVIANASGDPSVYANYYNTPSDTSTITPGEYYIYGRITGGGHTRYLYATQKIIFRQANTPDITPPNTSIVDGPSGTIPNNDVTFTFSGSDDFTLTSNLVYSYKLEGIDSNWSSYSLSNTKSYTNLANGSYTFQVKAKDEAGYVDSTPDERSFTINYIEPTITVTSPNGGESWNRGESFDITWDYSGNVGDYFWISIRYGGDGCNDYVYDEFKVPITGTYSWNIPSDLTIRSDYAIQISSPYSSIAYDCSDSVFSIIESSSIDVTPPNTSIVDGPSGTIPNNDVTFIFSGSDDFTLTSDLVYSYMLVGYDSNWSSYSLSNTKSYTNLANGSYTFQVKAKDEAELVDLSYASRSFTIVTLETDKIDIDWEQIFDAGGEEQGNSVVKVYGGYMAAGYTDLGDSYVARSDPSGSSYYGFNIGFTEANSIEESGKNTSIIVGSTSDHYAMEDYYGTKFLGGSNIYLSHVDYIGYESWHEIYGDHYQGYLNTDEYGYDVVVTDAESYIVVGSTSASSSLWKTYTHVIWIESDGSKQFRSNFAIKDGDNVGYSITRDEYEFYVTGYTTSYQNTLKYIYVLKLNLNYSGSISFGKVWGYDYGTGVGNSIEMTADGAIIAGTKNSNSYLLKVDKNGSKTWDMQLDSGEANSVKVDPNGDFIVLATKDDDIQLYKISSDGNDILWKKTFDTSNIDKGKDIIIDGQKYIVTGQRDGDLYLMKTTADVSFHPYDTDWDCIIGDFELLDSIDDWAVGQLGDFELLDLIDFWATGNYC